MNPKANDAAGSDTWEALRREREFLARFLAGYPTRIRTPQEARTVQEHWDRAIRLAEELARASPAPAGVRVILADLLRMGHNMDVPEAGHACQQILTEVLAADPENAEAHYTMGQLLVSVNPAFAPAAEKHLLAVVRLSPAVSPNVYQALGFACLYQKRVPEAISYFERYLGQVGGDPAVKTVVDHLRSGAGYKIGFKPAAPPKRKWWQFWK